ncbi:hypothetical protein BD311DRAFT_745009 [Dichomitus squalens]|uniref:Uncharacterized protein n=1 Tax=Dichomitus squalens TaxID=114155 RepID=A0A4Q9N4A0_9APHY|nr:hypothetical protein BD311DRAFT_745009 [Dichomitus squalens]
MSVMAGSLYSCLWWLASRFSVHVESQPPQRILGQPVPCLAGHTFTDIELPDV